MSTNSAHANSNTHERSAQTAHAPAPLQNRPLDPHRPTKSNPPAQPPFVGSAKAEPPSDSERGSRSDSQRGTRSDSERGILSDGEPGIQNDTEPTDIAAYDPSALLHALALLDFSPSALAEQLNISPFALLDWFESEETQQQLTRYQNIERQMLDLRAFKSRRLSIENLEHVLETTQDLVEKRRTATTLLRLLTRPPSEGERTTKRRSDASPASKPRHSEPGSASDESEPRSGSGHGDDASRVRQREHAQTESASPPAEPGSVSDHGTPAAPQPFDSHPAPEAQSPEKYAAQPPFHGSAQAEPPSEASAERSATASRRTASANRTRATINEDSATKEPRAEIDWDTFFPEASTGRDGSTTPTPHQRE